MRRRAGKLSRRARAQRRHVRPLRRHIRALRDGAALALGLSAVATAHVRLIHPTNGNNLRWSAPSDISIVINATGSEDLTDGSHLTALRGAIDAWNDVTGTTAQLVENTSGSQQARTDWQDNDIHLILFDENDDSGYFGGSGTVALTPVWFTSGGTITDADVLFNGTDYQFTTSGAPGAFDIEDVATHELGHLLGLDHSGWAGATMYPYVDPTIILHRSVSLDEVRGMRDMYPNKDHASIRGQIKRSSDESNVAGAHVVARNDDGRPIAGALASSGGNFELDGLAAGSYELYATPLDFPVSSGNLGAGHTVQTNFASTLLGTFSVDTGEDVDVDELFVDANVSLRLGSNMDEYPLRCIAGTTQPLAVRGAGLVNGSTLEASDPTLTVTPIAWLNTQVTFQVTVPAGANPGHVDLTVIDPGSARSILAGVLEITPPDPLVDDVSPTTGTHGGGTALTISGSNFQSGARVVLGPNIYEDGEPQGCTVVDDTTITLTTRATQGGTYDAVVIDSTGVEGRKVAAFQFAAIPTVQTCFPGSGSSAGGTTVTIRGEAFANGCVVRIDGVQQSQVTVVSETRLTLITDAGVPGGPYLLEVENPGGAFATSAFAYVVAPDPSIAAIDPPQASEQGGNHIVIHGANFTADCTVLFGASAASGAGGTPASSVTFVDANTLEVVTPEHASGVENLLVLESTTGQAIVAANAFTFTASDDGGGSSGGGCSVAPIGGARGPLDALAGCVWMLLALASVFVRAQRRRAVAIVALAWRRSEQA